MARHPEWFERLDPILDVVRQSVGIETIGRKEMKAIFGCSERDSIRLLHKFGAQVRDNALSVERSALLAQLQAIRSGSTFGAFLRQRQGVARQLAEAGAEAAARRFRVAFGSPGRRGVQLDDLPKTIAWRRPAPKGPGRFEILYKDGADLMRQIAEFLSAASVSRDEFLAGTEPADGAAR
jgi:hypothetical protein